MKIISYPDPSQWPELLLRPALDIPELSQKVRAILDAVRKEGDAALLRYTQLFDEVQLTSMEVGDIEIREAEKRVSPELKEALKVAKANIETFHRSQVHEEAPVATMPGVLCWRKSVAIEKVGLYIPGGSAPLFSTLLMLAVPARLAGCKELVLCTPPGKDGKVHPAILYVASMVGVTKIFKVGGAQAIAAMAYGTESIPKVYKIFGPGNAYVTQAKELVSAEGVAIDMPAGPSEVAVVADASANPRFVAADLLSQAEHGPDSQVILATTDLVLAQSVQEEVLRQLEDLPRKEIAKKALAASRCFVLRNETEVMELINAYAPEHLILSVAEPHRWADQVVNAGSVFLGHYTPESVGDYASGTNHTLPTYGYARSYSGVSLDSFVKKITFQELSPEGLKALGPSVEVMAEAEELVGHKRAVSVRLETL